MVDGSNSVGYTSFDKMKAWIGDFIKNFDLSESTTRVGLVQYSDRISTRNGSNLIFDIFVSIEVTKVTKGEMMRSNGVK